MSSDQRRFHWSVIALSLPASDQIELFFPLLGIGEELALSFDEGLRRAGEHAQDFTSEQQAALFALDSKISNMSGQPNDFWFDNELLASSPAWQEIRELAARVVDAFGWPSDLPELPPEQIYLIKGKSKP